MPPPKPLNLTAAIRFISVTLFLSFHFYSNSQTLNLAFKAGGTGRDDGVSVHIDNAGNVLVAGLFSNITDFDPSAAVFNLTSAGSEDIFVAKYTSSGQFLWAFRVGGSDRDHCTSVTSDASNNVIITGFFRGSNVDFDPSAASANLTSNGDAGSDPGYGGDMFVAKYDAAGQYQWAFHVGGSTMYDAGVCVATDAASNIYVGGYFRETVDFDPSAGVSTLNSLAGTLSLSKYSPAGNYQWAFNAGLGDQDNAIFDMKVDNNGNVYVGGYFQGTNIDFDPSAGTALLSSYGGYEIFFGKYTTNGQYVFAHSIGGSSIDVARGIDIDNNGNIYLIGDFTGNNIDFNPGAGTAALTSNGSADVFLAKYTNSGNYVWAFNFGAGASDIGWKVSTDNTHLFVTGGFTGTSDMNPSAIVDNLVSNGGNDIFLGKYNLNGEYLCAFNIGGPSDDYGSAIRTAGTNIFYLTGYFQGSNVDFDPTATTFNLSSNGGNEAFLSKFTWPDNVPPAGTIAGSVICVGQQAKLTFNAIAGTAPFTIVYNNGTSNVTVTNVQSGVPFNIVPNPASTTIYTLVSVRDAAKCSETSLASGAATVTVNQLPQVVTNNDTSICQNGQAQLTAFGAVGYSWLPAAGLSNASIFNPIASPVTSTQYIVTGIAANGCSANDTVTVNVHPVPAITMTNDTSICRNTSVQLLASGGISYSWSPSSSLNNPSIANPVASPPANTTYFVTIMDGNTCQNTDSVKVSLRNPAQFAASSPLSVCENGTVQLDASGGDTYLWSPASTLTDATIANPIASPLTSTNYSVTIIESICNETATLIVPVTVLALPSIDAAKSNDVDCIETTARLNATGAMKYKWAPSASLSNSNIANPIAGPTTTTLYTVEGTDAFGCKNTDTISVAVDFSLKNGLFLVPNAFTPNNDGLNDCFGIKMWGALEAIEFSIYNRWGELIFHTTDASKCWDGKWKGKEQDPAVFVYWIRAKSICGGDVFRKGTIVLIR